ncbi:MAG TPA: peptidoglycan DD-metalloendopeptidase family protein [Candidatus Aphodoplasma excrementigallinarum]|uniref:Peptidoglycan DD-metalloendopeptidase family protein n=1 Tax=Candidatus Aphodoplasma excrementigallinarum TaxID=2840673 RepID=A0A9D1SYW2_9FIRM|nr:peptidoglycan DD-metalloendopeptidase family protein [Candidatus Aphodoplasma excrementigallinarum]
MKKKTMVIICITLAAAMVLAVVGPVAISGMYSMMAEAASESELNNKLDENEKAQQELQDELDSVTQEKKEMQAEKDRLDSEIADLATEIDSITRTIAQNESDIAQKEAEIESLEQEIEENDELLKTRLRVMYEKGSTGYIDVLFSATSFSDLLLRMDMIQQIYEHDQALIKEMETAKATVETAKAEIEAAKTANEGLQADLETERAAMQQKSDESDSVIARLAQSEEELQAELEEREQENQDILDQIAAAKAAQQASSNYNAVAANTYTGGQLGWPSTSRGTITSTFGWRTFRGVPNNHTGLDIAVPMGTPVLACEDGVVTGSGWRNSYGYCITIDHGSITTLYAHNSVLQVSVGQTVQRGQQIALAGSTGNSTGPHIHLGVIANGQYVNPAPYVGL